MARSSNPTPETTNNDPAQGAPAAAPAKRKGRKPGSKNKPKPPADAVSSSISVRLDVEMTGAQILGVLQDHVVSYLESNGMGGTFTEMELQLNDNGVWKSLACPIRFATKSPF